MLIGHHGYSACFSSRCWFLLFMWPLRSGHWTWACSPWVEHWYLLALGLHIHCTIYSKCPSDIANSTCSN
jgi:hypothetical protein